MVLRRRTVLPVELAEDQSTRKQVGLILAGVFLGLVFVAITFYTDPKGLRHAERWANLPWEETTCVVHHVGIAYRGNCRIDVQVGMTDDVKFEECAGPSDERRSLEHAIEEWELTEAGRCALDGDAYYLRGTEEDRFSPALVDGEIDRNATEYQRYAGAKCLGTPYTIGSKKECNGWTGLTERLCELRCTSNIGAPDCGRQEETRHDLIPGDVCAAAAFYPDTGACQLYSACDVMEKNNLEHVVSLKKVGAEKLDASKSEELPARRLRLPVNDNFHSFNPPNLQCYNSYLAWALVRANHSSSVRGKIKSLRCAYEYGAELASEEADWDTVLNLHEKLAGSLMTGEPFRCWTLPLDDCVVAFRNETRLEGEELYRHHIIRVGGIIFAILFVSAIVFVCVWHCQDQGYCQAPDTHGYHIAIPTTEPEPDDMISDRVRAIMGMVGGHLDSPLASGESTLRVGNAQGSNRTIEVVGPDGVMSALPRNVAADFLNARRH